MPISRKAHLFWPVRLMLIPALTAVAGCAESTDDAAAARSEAADTPMIARVCETLEAVPAPGTRRVFAYFACSGAAPGQLHPVARLVADSIPAIEGALAELVAGPTEAERARGFRSFFGPPTADALRDVRVSASGDTVQVDFDGLFDKLPNQPGVTSFLPPGVMAELTWTLFQQFPRVQALRFSDKGSERDFWARLGGPPEVFTRRDWERI